MALAAGSGGPLAIVLAGHAKLRNGLHRPQWRSSAIVLPTSRVQGKDAVVASMIDDAAVALLAERLRAPLQIEQHLSPKTGEGYKQPMRDEAKSFAAVRQMPRIQLARHVPLSMPLIIYVEPTNRCNFGCRFCPESLPSYSTEAGGLRRLDLDSFKKICADIKSLGRLKTLRFWMMGEPLLNKEVFAMIAHAKELDIADRTELTTNGSALTPAAADAIIRSGLDYLRVSIYGMDPERHRIFTGSPISPERIAGNVAHLVAQRRTIGAINPVVSVRMIEPGDVMEANQFVAAYSTLVDEVCIEASHNWNGYDALDLKQRQHDGTTREATIELPGRHPKEVCPSPFYVLVVHADGEVGACCVDWSRKTSIGNIFRDSLADIWNGPRLRDFRRMHIERRREENEACRHCDYLYQFPDNLDEIRDARILDVRA